MRIVVILAQVVLALALSYGGYWLYTWHQAHPNANVNEVTVQAAATGATSEQARAQEMIRQWIVANMTDKNATIERWSQIVPLRGNQCVVAVIAGKTRSDRKIIRTYAFEFKGSDILLVKSGTDYLSGLETDIRSEASADTAAALTSALEHLKLIVAEVAKEDTPT